MPCLVTQLCPTLCDPMDCPLWPYGLWPARLLCPWWFPRQGYMSGLPYLLQGIFPTQGSKPGVPHAGRVEHMNLSPILTTLALNDRGFLNTLVEWNSLQFSEIFIEIIMVAVFWDLKWDVLRLMTVAILQVLIKHLMVTSTKYILKKC